MKVLSLFDGLSGGMIALDRLGIKVNKYYASEIDKYAIQVSKHNYPNIEHIGSVTDLKDEYLESLDIDLLIGGSPCQGFSLAGTMKGSSTACGVDVTSLEQYLQLKEDDFEFNGQSYLFWEYVRVWKIVKPKYFFLENVRVTKQWLPMFNEAMGVEPIMINSSLVSAQNRVRFYWTNIQQKEQPKDKGILLKDVLSDNVDKKFYLTDKAVDYMSRLRNGKPRFEYHKNPLDGKAACVVAVQYKGVSYGVIKERPCESRDFKEESLCHHTANATDINGSESIKRVYAETGKSPTLTTMQGGHREPKVLHSENTYRKLTPLECERLQTLPENYTDVVSNSQRYKMIGNGWTIDIITHFFKEII